MNFFITPVAVSDIPRKPGKRHPIQDMVCEIAHSDYEAVEIDWRAMGYKNLKNARNSFYSAIYRDNVKLRPVQREDRLFLVKKGE